jgi:predicted ArsR family transcriptional regulator
MDPTDFRLIQQIIAHDSGALSLKELDYRNTDLGRDQIRERLESLQKTGVVAALPADPVRDDMPSKFWAVTEQGIEELRTQVQSEQTSILHEASSAAEIMSAADDALNRSERIEKIEQFDGRPSVPERY